MMERVLKPTLAMYSESSKNCAIPIRRVSSFFLMRVGISGLPENKKNLHFLVTKGCPPR